MGGMGSTVYDPIVRFRTVQGETIEFRGSFGGNPSKYQRGERLRVLYDPTKPETAEIENFFSLWGDSLFRGVAGLIFSIIGVRGLYSLHRRRNE